jgi:quercetin dioxygenase-like cupin family protein
MFAFLMTMHILKAIVIFVVKGGLHPLKLDDRRILMKKSILLCLGLIVFLATGVFALDIPKGLIDSKPDQAILINLDEWYAKNPVLDKKGLIAATVAASPRSMVTIRTGVKGWSAGAHYHATADEIVIVVGGSGEILVNGKWMPVKKGDVHVNPRGIVHDTRAVSENLQFISIFTPQLAAGGDANYVK